VSNAEEIAAAFERVDSFLMAAGEVAPSVELLLARARQQGITEAAMLRHLRLSSTTARWLLKLEPAAADRSSAELVDVGELVLRWARAG
jgi:orotate phosphoribosyltransferase-like protein